MDTQRQNKLHFFLFKKSLHSKQTKKSKSKKQQEHLTGVSGSRENRFKRSSLLAERIPSSVSEIYCKEMKKSRTLSLANTVFVSSENCAILIITYFT